MPFVSDDPVLAVISPPNVERFRALVGIAPDEEITVDFSGWSKLALLTDELAILFPRDHTHARYLTYEIEALEAVANAGLPEVPEILGAYRDAAVSAYEFVVERRLPGEMLDRRLREITSDELGDVLEQMARLAARWHALEPGPLRRRPPRTHPAEAFVDELLREGGARDVDVEMAPAERARFNDVLDRVRSLPPVLVHTDLHEGQLLVDSELRLTGVLDWQTARVGHPFTEFDLGEWGTAAWRVHHRAFPLLRRRMWQAYAIARGFDDDLVDEFAIFWAVVQAHRWPMSVHVGSEVTGTREETLAAMHEAFAT